MVADSSDNQRRLEGLSGSSPVEPTGPLPWDSKPVTSSPAETSANEVSAQAAPAPVARMDPTPTPTPVAPPTPPVMPPQEPAPLRAAGEYSDPVTWFNRPAWKDPAFFVGWGIAVLLALPRVFATGSSGFSTSGAGIISGLLDGAFFMGITFLLFCLLPAFIRKLVRGSRLKKPPHAGAPAGWYPDPVRRGQERRWDGTQWTAAARGGRPPRSGTGGVLGLIGGGAALILLVAVISVA